MPMILTSEELQREFWNLKAVHAEMKEMDAVRVRLNREYCAKLDAAGGHEAWRKFVEAEHRTIIVKPLTATEKDSQ